MIWRRRPHEPVGLARRPPVRRLRPFATMPGRLGFTLVEVIVVTVVLSVLLLGVWSLFAMQQRTLERGQRLSRQARVTLALQRLFQEDLARTVERVGAPDRPGLPNRSAPSSSPSAFPVPEALAAESWNESGMVDETADGSAETVPPRFLFAGGSDWLIVDVRRPAYQMDAFSSLGSGSDDALAAATPSLGSSAGLSGLNLDPQALPERRPSPFERLIYLWLTDAEIQEITGLTFGQPTDGLDTNGQNQTGATANAGDRASSSLGRSELPAAAPQPFDASGNTRLDRIGPRRTLLRIRTDWSWPREDESMGVSWDQAIGGDGTDDPLSDLNVPLGAEGGSTTAVRRQWLRRLLWQATGGYREFHLQSGSALASDGPADDRTLEEGPQPDPADPAEGSAAATDRWLPNLRQPQVDWFPEVIAGKFQYFDGNTWQDSFRGPGPADGGDPLPMAVRLQFAVDPRQVPQPVSMDASVAGRNELGSTLDSTAGQPSWMNDEPMADPLGALVDDRPEFPHVTVFSFRSQATRRPLSERTDPTALPESAVDNADDPTADPTRSGTENLFDSRSSLRPARGAFELGTPPAEVTS